ncbi:lysozyme [Campylobacter sp. CCUG 57310]|uniref:lysozyme n=1 Tax=Campylobacter sp. CCUG 57310 TaxID=2517362 RepID=UPI001565CE07|nr:lysozyme [Campylobacter sp. CCUG 57310]
MMKVISYKLSNLHVRDTKNKQSLQNKYQIYLDNANNQTTPLSSTSNITAYYGINLIDTLNKSKFIKAFNEAKARVGLKDEEGVMLVVESESILFMSEQGRNFLKDIEICKLDPYDDQTGKVIKEWNIHATIGYGHLISEKEWSQYEKGITREQAGELFDNDLLKYEDAVVVSIKKYVTQNQFDALVIFCYNIGVNGFKNSSVVKIINGQKSNYSSLEDAWKAWGKSNGKQNKGLENRRNAEYKIYSEGKYERW